MFIWLSYRITKRRRFSVRCKIFANPYYDGVLRQHIGQDEKVGEYIMKDPIFEKSWEQISSLIVTLNPEYKKERKSYLTVTFG